MQTRARRPCGDSSQSGGSWMRPSAWRTVLGSGDTGFGGSSSGSTWLALGRRTEMGPASISRWPSVQFDPSCPPSGQIGDHIVPHLCMRAALALVSGELTFGSRGTTKGRSQMVTLSARLRTASAPAASNPFRCERGCCGPGREVLRAEDKLGAVLSDRPKRGSSAAIRFPYGSSVRTLESRECSWRIECAHTQSQARYAVPALPCFRSDDPLPGEHDDPASRPGHSHPPSAALVPSPTRPPLHVPNGSWHSRLRTHAGPGGRSDGRFLSSGSPVNTAWPRLCCRKRKASSTPTVARQEPHAALCGDFLRPDCSVGASIGPVGEAWRRTVAWRECQLAAWRDRASAALAAGCRSGPWRTVPFRDLGRPASVRPDGRLWAEPTKPTPSAQILSIRTKALGRARVIPLEDPDPSNGAGPSMVDLSGRRLSHWWGDHSSSGWEPSLLPRPAVAVSESTLPRAVARILAPRHYHTTAGGTDALSGLAIHLRNWKRTQKVHTAARTGRRCA